MKQKNHSELWFDCSDKNISYFARVPQKGPELDLVYEFLNRIVLKTRMPNQSQAIFIEPKLASGFPDVVIASYAPKNYSNKFWKKERSLIVPQDLKFLWYLYGQNGADNIQVIKELNLSSAILLN